MINKGMYGIPSTPFDNKGMIDENELEKEIDFIVRAGAHGIVGPIMVSVFGQLSDKERKKFMKITTKTVNNRVPVILNVAGLTTPVALEFTEYALKLGADGLIALPPYAKPVSSEEMFEYYKAISNMAESQNVPIVIQDPGNPRYGGKVSEELMIKMANELPAIQYVKEEIPPAGHRISKLVNKKEEGLKGVFGGNAGLYLIDEMKRGCYGCMLGSGTIDVQAQIFDKFQEGKEKEALEIYYDHMPMVVLEIKLGDHFVKEILKRRGALDTKGSRIDKLYKLDELDMEEIDQAIARVEKYFKI